MAPDRAQDPWARLREATRARIGLGRTGDAMPIGAVLEFQLAHARARDAVHAPLDVAALVAGLSPRASVAVRSACPDRVTYLRRPDLGRRLHEEDRAALAGGPFDAVFVLADGLSALAVQRHAAAVLDAVEPLLPGWRIGPVVVATQARVALGDDVGEALGAGLVAVLVGERPGLTAADSLGIYLTHAPRRGRMDSERNCISNIHGGGLSPIEGAEALAWLMRAARARGSTGVGLKDERAVQNLLR